MHIKGIYKVISKKSKRICTILSSLNISEKAKITELSGFALMYYLSILQNVDQNKCVTFKIWRKNTKILPL